MFITFEGIEGGGKSTQIQKISDALIQEGYNIIQTKEPGGTAIGQELRRMILDPNQRFHSPYTEVMLFFADRLEHVETVIKPALASGKIVLCDRYIDSTIAYQIGGRGMPKPLIDTLTQLVDLKPNLTLLFDLSPEEGLQRAKKRAALDRFEQESIDFHSRIRHAYLDQAKKEPDRIKVISASCDIEPLFEQLMKDYIQPALS